MRTAAAHISVALSVGLVGACAPAASFDDASREACAGTCDGAGGEAELLYGERRPVGPVGDFGIMAEWTDVAEIVIEPGARARLSLEPRGGGSMPELTVYRDFGTSIEFVAESEPGADSMAIEGADERARYVVEIYGAPDATGGAILELECLTGACGPRVEVTLTEQRLRETPVEVRDATRDDAWGLFRVDATRERFADVLPVAAVADRMAVTPASAERLASEVGAGTYTVERVGEVELSEVEAYRGGDEALDAFAAFLDPEGHRFEARFGTARIAHELVGDSGEIVEVVQEIAVLLLRSQGDESDLVVALDRRSVR